MPVKIAIIGGGVMGLSAGVHVQQRYPDAQVTMYAEALTPNTTGDVAAGLWGPYATKDDDRVIKWAKTTYDYLYSLLVHPEQDKIGVTFVLGFKLDGGDTNENLPSWGEIPHGIRRMTPQELTICPTATGGWTYYVPICEGKQYNTWIFNKYQENGGIVVNRKINSFAELADENFDCIINCTGLGAKTLCNDNEVHPIRGQVRRVRAPWITWFVIQDTDDGCSYVIPNAGTIILGGTRQVDDWCTEVRQQDLDAIVASTGKMIPSLLQAEVLRDQVGLRPGRSSIRLELETITLADKQKQLKVIHNYGHGGSGYTLFHGCTQEVMDLLAGVLQSAWTNQKSVIATEEQT